MILDQYGKPIRNPLKLKRPKPQPQIGDGGRESMVTELGLKFSRNGILVLTKESKPR